MSRALARHGGRTVQGFVGLVVILGLAWLFSERRRDVRVLEVAVGSALLFAVGFVLLKVPLISDSILLLNALVVALDRATMAGTELVFGYLGSDTHPFYPERSMPVIFAFRVLPQILVFSVVVAILWYWRVLPLVIRGFAWALRRALRVGGAVGVAAASSVFLGMVEAPLAIRAYLNHLSRSEFFVVMTCGMSTVAGSIMVVYATILGPVLDGALGHIFVASIMSVVGAVVIARIMIPETREATAGDMADSLKYDNMMDAISRGTTDGLRLVAYVASTVIVLVALVALVNHVLGQFEVLGEPLTAQRILGWVLAPLAWSMGIPWQDAPEAGALLGTKVILNELFAYFDFAAIAETLAPESRLILTYALCGFANFGSVGILIGGIGALVPDRRGEMLALAPRSIVSGTLVACLTGVVVGLIG